VLAMEPGVLILDEPCAGLDPAGAREILNLIKNLHEKKNITVILVSHNMEDVANYVDRAIVMNKGRVMYDDIPKNVFKNIHEMEVIGLSVPEVTYLSNELNKMGYNIPNDIVSVDEFCSYVKMNTTGV